MILHFKRLALRLLCPWLIKEKFIVAMLSGKSLFVSPEKPGSSPINTKHESLKNSNARGSISSSEEWLLVPKLLYFSLNLVIYSTNAFLFQYVETYWRIPKAEFALINVFQFTSFVSSQFFSKKTLIPIYLFISALLLLKASMESILRLSLPQLLALLLIWLRRVWLLVLKVLL